MKLSAKAISEFQVTYKQVFGSEIATVEAQDKGLDLLRFFKLVYRKVSTVEEGKLAMYKSSESIYKSNTIGCI